MRVAEKTTLQWHKGSSWWLTPSFFFCISLSLSPVWIKITEPQQPQPAEGELCFPSQRQGDTLKIPLCVWAALGDQGGGAALEAGLYITDLVYAEWVSMCRLNAQDRCSYWIRVSVNFSDWLITWIRVLIVFSVQLQCLGPLLDSQLTTALSIMEFLPSVSSLFWSLHQEIMFDWCY